MLKCKVKFLYPNSLSPLDTGGEGYDLYVHHTEDLGNGFIKVYTGIAVEVNKGWHFELFPRSSCAKRKLHLINSIGLIDNSYRGEIIAIFRKLDRREKIMPGERILQLVPRKSVHCEFRVVGINDSEELSDTERDTGGFGSTGV